MVKLENLLRTVIKRAGRAYLTSETYVGWYCREVRFQQSRLIKAAYASCSEESVTAIGTQTLKAVLSVVVFGIHESFMEGS